MKDEGEDGPSASTLAREAYFVGFAGSVRKVASMPVMVTGGFRSVTGMVEALEGGDLDVGGLARPLIADPEAPRRLLAGEIDKLPSPESTHIPFHILPWNSMQIERLGDGLEPDLSLTGDAAMAAFVELEGRNMGALLDRRGRRTAQRSVADTYRV